jgi:Fe-S cluster biogenesis protein NfuA
MAESIPPDFEDQVYAAVAAAEEQFRAEDAALLRRENFPFLDDSDYAEMMGHIGDNYKGVEVDWVDPYTKTVVLKPEGGCAACAISSFHIQRAIGEYLRAHVDPETRVIVQSQPGTDF